MGGRRMTDGRDAVRERFKAAEDLPPLPEEGDGGGIDGPPDYGPPEADPPDDPKRRAALLPLNDVGNARRLVTYFGDDLVYVPRVGWFAWTGSVWEKDADELKVRAHGQDLAQLIEAEVPFVVLKEWQKKLLAELPALNRRIETLEVTEPEQMSQDQRDELGRLEDRRTLALKQRGALSDMRTAHRTFARSAGNADRIRKAIGEAQVLRARPLEAMDADPLSVNVANGILRFAVERYEGGRVSTVRLDPHDRAALQTKIAACGYDPDASAPLFEEFLARIQPAQDMRDFLRRWFGLSMTGLTWEQKLAFFYGHGANGKSVLVDLMAWMLGGYAATAKIESLTGQTKRGGADATPDLIPLMGARFVRASEPEQGERLKEGTIKELTGGEPILIRALHSDFVEVKPEFKLTISGNHKPEIRGTDDGIWRRMLLVPFDIHIPQAERDPDLGKKLRAEAPGILRWMVDGLIDYLDGGLREPARVLEATQDYRSDSDPVGTFLTECTIVTGASDDFMLARELIDAFNFWNKQREGTEWGGRTVSNALKSKAGHWRHPSTGAVFAAAKRQATGYRGIRLTDTFRRQLDSGAYDSGRQARDDDSEEMPL